MYPNNPIDSINSFLNRNFGFPISGKKARIPSDVAGTNQSQPIISSASPGATNPTPIVNTPAQKKLPDAGQKYVNNVMNSPSVAPAAYDFNTGARTDYGASIGVPNMYGGKSVTEPGAVTNSSNTGITSGSTASPAKNAYLEYLSSLFNPSALKGASENREVALGKLASIQNRQESRSLQHRRDVDAAMKRIGGTVGGRNQVIGEIDRVATGELADLALAESAAARSARVFDSVYSSMLDAGKSVYEAEAAATKAAQDQANRDREFGLDEKRFEQDKIEADRKFEEDKRQFGLQYALDEKKYNLDALKAGNESGTSLEAIAKKNQESSSTLNIINQLLQNDSLGSITGSVEQYRPSLLLGSNANLARNQFNQIKGILALENRQKLKGSGAISDFESKTLDSAASSLSRGLSEGEFKKQLKQIRGSIATSHGLNADVRVTDPNTNESQTVSADSAAIAQMVQDGLIIEYQ